MTLDKEDKKYLIDYRVSQAENSIGEVRKLIDLGMYAVAVNRIYYGIFYVLLALALKHEFDTSKHQQLLGWFNKNFIATGKVEKKFGRIVRQAYQNRVKGDYDAFISFSQSDVELMLDEMVVFIDALKRFISES